VRPAGAGADVAGHGVLSRFHAVGWRHKATPGGEDTPPKGLCQHRRKRCLDRGPGYPALRVLQTIQATSVS
jgi:hypothetical protein